jgi:hypothetical protein
LIEWQSQSSANLDELEAAHKRAGGSLPGRRYATRQINHSYAVSVAAHFQRFCRDLHSEASAAVTQAAPAFLQPVISQNLTHSRGLDRGNANSGTINPDFIRLGVDLWAEAKVKDRGNHERLRKLDQMNAWRNAIAHQDFDKAAASNEVGKSNPDQLAWIRRWRAACNVLAPTFDEIVASALDSLLGARPW